MGKTRDTVLNSGQVHVSKLFVSLRRYRDELSQIWVDPVGPAALDLIPLDVCRDLMVLPFACDENRIYVACTNLSDVQHYEYITEFALQQQRMVVLCRADFTDLFWAVTRLVKREDSARQQRLGEILVNEGKLSGEQLVQALDAQRTTGGRLGALLSSTNSLTSWDVATALAQQKQIPVIDLLHQPDLAALAGDPLLDSIWAAFPDEFWHQHQVAPLSYDGISLIVAMVNPDDDETCTILKTHFHCNLKVMVTGYRDMMALLGTKFTKFHEENSRLSLAMNHPEESASTRFSRPQILSAVIAVLICGGALAFRPLITLAWIFVILQLLYTFSSIFRLYLMQQSAKSDCEVVVTEEQLEKSSPAELPVYTLLIPVYQEAEVLPALVDAIKNLRYPKDRLEVKLLLEEDDPETIQVARESHLPNYMDMVIVPSSQPRTKPKACNYGLMRSRGEYVVIFDAEDIPERDQLLKAITAFRESKDPALACVQAKLSYYNANQNLLTRWFTAEYANWFELSLPALFAHNMPVPLGGTSNHFRADVLREMGAWDPYNVAEDADLGIRLHKHGYRTAVVNSTTYEEANADFLNWIRQRSRWVKGYMQTWLVNMRHPVSLHRSFGWVGSLAFHMIVGGTPFTFLLNPVMWFMTIAWFIFQPPFLHAVYDNPIYYLSELNFLFGNFAFTYVNVVGLMHRQSYSLVKYALLSPIYWIFMSLAAWKSLYQLFVRPSYWEKTIHGLTKQNVSGKKQPQSFTN